MQLSLKKSLLNVEKYEKRKQKEERQKLSEQKSRKSELTIGPYGLGRKVLPTESVSGIGSGLISGKGS